MRAFVALDLPPELGSRLADLVSALAPSLAGLRWVRPEGMHLTLRFLGDATPEQVIRLLSLLEPAALRTVPVEATVGGLGLFPDRGSPRVLWLGVSAGEALVRLQAACEAAAIATGFPPEPRPYRAHLTLGRWRDRLPRPSLPAADLGLARFDTLTLFQSELRPEGALYRSLGRWPLADPGAEG